MPTIRVSVAADTPDALSNRKFSVVPPAGAILNLFASGAAGDAFGLSIGDRDIIVPGTPLNVASAAGVVDIDRDQLVWNEIIGGGQLFLPVELAAAGPADFLIHLRYL